MNVQEELKEQTRCACNASEQDVVATYVPQCSCGSKDFQVDNNGNLVCNKCKQILLYR